MVWTQTLESVEYTAVTGSVLDFGNSSLWRYDYSYRISANGRVVDIRGFLGVLTNKPNVNLTSLIIPLPAEINPGKPEQVPDSSGQAVVVLHAMGRTGGGGFDSVVYSYINATANAISMNADADRWDNIDNIFFSGMWTINP